MTVVVKLSELWFQFKAMTKFNVGSLDSRRAGCNIWKLCTPLFISQKQLANCVQSLLNILVNLWKVNFWKGKLAYDDTAALLKKVKSFA